MRKAYQIEALYRSARVIVRDDRVYLTQNRESFQPESLSPRTIAHYNMLLLL
jgi:hypothetical protein